MIPDLFSDKNTCHAIDLPDADISLYPCFFDVAEADYYFNELMSQIAWSEKTIKLYGKEHKVPRLSAWYADEGKSYEYSGLRTVGLPWVPVLAEIKNIISSVSPAPFNSVLANLYRNGDDGVGWHADDEPELGSSAIIVSISFGEERNFQLKHKRDKTLKKNLLLTHGSLLIMQGKTQENWLHQVPKSSRTMGERINLTFRVVD